jgi:hypothetical protein
MLHLTITRTGEPGLPAPTALSERQDAMLALAKMLETAANEEPRFSASSSHLSAAAQHLRSYIGASL